MTPEQAKKLREPFNKEQIGKLPKPTKKDNPKGKCNECGGWHGLPAVHLDYVGHAATTDRLIQVDPEWSWEPMAYGPNGEPLMTNGGMWIKLTIAGVTRPGFGDGATPKEVIGDAIRNAAMRFGVALDLWAKEDLQSSDVAAGTPVTAKKPGKASPPGAPSREPVTSDVSEGETSAASDGTDAAQSPDGPPSASSPSEEPVMISFTQRGRITQLIVEAAAANNSTVDHLTKSMTDSYGPFDKLTAAKADELIGKLARWADNAQKAVA